MPGTSRTSGGINLINVIGTTGTWSPSLGSTTTFSDTLLVACYPIQATLASQGTSAFLSWTGGGPPYRVQRAIDPVTGNWTDFLSNAVPSLTLPWTLPLRSTAQPANEDDARPHFGHGLGEAVDPWNL